MKTSIKKSYWYKYYYGECPLCGRDYSYKERMYTKKPKDKKDRVVYLSDTFSYCGCDVIADLYGVG